MLGLFEKDVFRSALNWIENLERLISVPQITELKSGTRILKDLKDLKSVILYQLLCHKCVYYPLAKLISKMHAVDERGSAEIMVWEGSVSICHLHTEAITLKSLADQNVWGKRYILMSFLSGSMTSTGHVRGI